MRVRMRVLGSGHNRWLLVVTRVDGRRPGARRSLDSERLDFLGVKVLPGFIGTLHTRGAGSTLGTSQRASPEEEY